MKKANYKQAKKIAIKNGLAICEDGRTFYATDEQETGLYEFDSKKERDTFLELNR